MNVKITGMDSVRRNLRSLPKELMKSAETAVLRAGATPILKASKSMVPKDSGLLKKSLGLRVATLKGQKSARVGPRTGMKQTVSRKLPNGKTIQVLADPNKYSHLVEYGTSHSAAKPFIRPAIDQSEGQVIDAMAAGLDKHLDKVAAKLRRKGGSR